MKQTKDKLFNADEKAACRGSRRRGFPGVKGFFIGIICGIVITVAVTSVVHSSSIKDTLLSLFTKEEKIAEEHDMIIENTVVTGYTVADFQEAILGKEQKLEKLEVYLRELSDVVVLTDTGFANIKAFTKYQYITYHGRATYTVNLQNLKNDNISLDEESKTITILIPPVHLEPINIPAEDIEFNDVEKQTPLALGKIKITPEESAAVEKEAKDKMMEKLEEENVIEDAKKAAEYAVWDLFQPLVAEVSPEYSLVIQFVE